MDSLRVGRNWPEVSERLTILVIVGTSTDEHSLRSQVRTGSESDCLFGQLNRILWTSDSKTKKTHTTVMTFLCVHKQCLFHTCIAPPPKKQIQFIPPERRPNCVF